MPTPLESFIETLHKRHRVEDTRPDVGPMPPVFSLSVHTHTSGTFPNADAEMECETKCEGALTLQEVSIQPGSCITWQRADGKLRGPATVNFVHTDPDATLWAFVTLPDGWAAVNTRYATVRGQDKGRSKKEGP